ncbi:unnamed protein product [Amoebophrya sp. A25]|nr:unnamed protein product [Amoebophrya sp. A25]|eukprot:GSA25T00013785001.1
MFGRSGGLSLWSLTDAYGDIVDCIVRPPRREYKAHQLGPSTFFRCGRQWWRQDLELRNLRGQRLVCSHYREITTPEEHDGGQTKRREDPQHRQVSGENTAAPGIEFAASSSAINGRDNPTAATSTNRVVSLVHAEAEEQEEMRKILAGQSSDEDRTQLMPSTSRSIAKLATRQTSAGPTPDAISHSPDEGNRTRSRRESLSSDAGVEDAEGEGTRCASPGVNGVVFASASVWSPPGVPTPSSLSPGLPSAAQSPTHLGKDTRSGRRSGNEDKQEQDDDFFYVEQEDHIYCALDGVVHDGEEVRDCLAMTTSSESVAADASSLSPSGRGRAAPASNYCSKITSKSGEDGFRSPRNYGRGRDAHATNKHKNYAKASPRATPKGRSPSTSSKGGSRSPPPCVIYLHGNSSCRLEAKEIWDYCLPLGFSLFCFDFAGSGNSDGDHVSLGFFEKDDLHTVIRYLQACAHVGPILLWGRSMGAVTAVKYCFKYVLGDGHKEYMEKLEEQRAQDPENVTQDGDEHEASGVGGTALSAKSTESATPVPVSTKQKPSQDIEHFLAGLPTPSPVQHGSPAKSSVKKFSPPPRSSRTKQREVRQRPSLQPSTPCGPDQVEHCAATIPHSPIAGLVLDSPFSNFRQLIRELVSGDRIAEACEDDDDTGASVTTAAKRFLVAGLKVATSIGILEAAVQVVRSSVRNRAGFDIHDLDILEEDLAAAEVGQQLLAASSRTPSKSSTKSSTAQNRSRVDNKHTPGKTTEGNVSSTTASESEADVGTEHASSRGSTSAPSSENEEVVAARVQYLRSSPSAQIKKPGGRGMPVESSLPHENNLTAGSSGSSGTTRSSTGSSSTSGAIKNEYEIQTLTYESELNKLRLPVYFLAGTEDTFILPRHSQLLHAFWGGMDKRLELMTGADHNSQRSALYLKRVRSFLARAARECQRRVSAMESMQRKSAHVFQRMNLCQICQSFHDVVRNNHAAMFAATTNTSSRSAASSICSSNVEAAGGSTVTTARADVATSWLKRMAKSSSTTALNNANNTGSLGFRQQQLASPSASSGTGAVFITPGPQSGSPSKQGNQWNKANVESIRSCQQVLHRNLVTGASVIEHSRCQLETEGYLQTRQHPSSPQVPMMSVARTSAPRIHIGGTATAATSSALAAPGGTCPLSSTIRDSRVTPSSSSSIGAQTRKQPPKANRSENGGESASQTCSPFGKRSAGSPPSTPKLGVRGRVFHTPQSNTPLLKLLPYPSSHNNGTKVPQITALGLAPTSTSSSTSGRNKDVLEQEDHIKEEVSLEDQYAPGPHLQDERTLPHPQRALVEPRPCDFSPSVEADGDEHECARSDRNMERTTSSNAGALSKVSYFYYQASRGSKPSHAVSSPDDTRIRQCHTTPPRRGSQHDEFFTEEDAAQSQKQRGQLTKRDPASPHTYSAHDLGTCISDGMLNDKDKTTFSASVHQIADRSEDHTITRSKVPPSKPDPALQFKPPLLVHASSSVARIGPTLGAVPGAGVRPLLPVLGRNASALLKPQAALESPSALFAKQPLKAQVARPFSVTTQGGQNKNAVDDVTPSASSS